MAIGKSFNISSVSEMRRPLLKIALTISIALLLCASLLVLVNSHHVTMQQRQILYHTNAQALLNECVLISNNKSHYRHDPDWHNLSPGDFTYPDPSDPAMPGIVAQLRPGYIVIDPNSVTLEFGGGFLHFGVTAFMNGSPGHGTLQLTPGLWYFSDDGKIPPK
ncbi:MAG: hypothetical protein ABSG31_07000 [Tepidisphaeraceae bacterium]|jgi:hypothetical protein